MTMEKKKHYKKQLNYFEKEFSGVKEYRLAPWQKTYIGKIKNQLLGKNYKNKTLLDIATGSGYVAMEMARMGLNVIACDLSPQAIKNLEKYKKQYKLKNLKLIVCKAEDIPLKNESVDYIVANAILEHIPDETATIKEWKRILKKNGTMLITVPIKFRYVWPFFWPLNFIHDKRIGHLRRYDYDSLSKKFNLPIKKHYYTGHFVKVVGAIISIIFKFSNYDEQYEIIDQRNEDKKYGASNISVIFKK